MMMMTVMLVIASFSTVYPFLLELCSVGKQDVPFLLPVLTTLAQTRYSRNAYWEYLQRKSIYEFWSWTVLADIILQIPLKAIRKHRVNREIHVQRSGVPVSAVWTWASLFPLLEKWTVKEINSSFRETSSGKQLIVYTYVWLFLWELE